MLATGKQEGRSPEQDGFDALAVFDECPEQIVHVPRASVVPVVRLGTGEGYFVDYHEQDLLDPAKAVASLLARRAREVGR